MNRIAAHFYVSKLMIARLALTYGKINKADYKAIHAEELEAFRSIPKSDGGPNFLALVPNRNSVLITKTVVNQAISGNMLLRDAGNLLHVSPQNIIKMGGM